jgi:hypothetical protein
LLRYEINWRIDKIIRCARIETIIGNKRLITYAAMNVVVVSKLCKI